MQSKVIGYIGMWNVIGEGQVTNLAVHKNYRHQGIAKLLVSSMVEYATQQDMEFIILEVRKSNELAQSLYKQFGFDEISTRKGYYSLPKEDAVIMRLNVGRKEV